MAKRSEETTDRAVPGGPKGLRMRGPKPRYYFKRQDQGRRYTIALGTSLDQARMKAQQFINAMERGDFSPVSIQRDRTGIVQFLDDALTAQTARNNLAEKSVAAYSSRVRHFLAYLYDEHPQVARLSEITPGIAAGYVEWRRRQKVSRSGKALPTTPKSHPAAQTVHDDVRRLRALFSVAVQREILHANPFAGVRVPVKANDRKAPPRGLTEDQARKLLMAASKFDRAPRGPGALSTFKGMMREIIEFYLLTGLRKQELVHLAWSHVDQAHDRLQRDTPLSQSEPESVPKIVKPNRLRQLGDLQHPLEFRPHIAPQRSSIGVREYERRFPPRLVALREDLPSPLGEGHPTLRRLLTPLDPRWN